MPVPAAAPTGPGLQRIFGVIFGLAIGVGSMIGAGILRTPGSVAAAVPDAALILGLWTLGAVHALLEANVVAELGASIPSAGGPFVPVHRAFGEAGGLLIGWTDLLNSAASIAALVLAGTDFLALVTPAAAPHPLLLAVGLIAGLFVLNAAGAKESGTAQIVLTAIKLALLGIIALGAAALVPAAAPIRAQDTIVHIAGWAGIVAAYQLISGAYAGWATPLYFAEEDTAPGRNLPRALMGSVAAVAALYLAINLALLHVFSVAVLGRLEIPVGEIIRRLSGPAGSAAIGITGFSVILGCCNAGLMAAPRIVVGLARIGLFPRAGQQISARGTPQVGLAVVAVASALLVLTGSFEAAFKVVAASGALTLFALDAALFALRRREPTLDRPYRAAFYPLLPGLALVCDGLFFAAIVWFDPLSGAITAGTLVAALVAWSIVRRWRGSGAAPTAADA